MSGHRKWDDGLNELIRDNPEVRAGYEAAREALDRAWEVLCRYECCVWWVCPDSNVREDLGGYGPVGCPCKDREDSEQ